MDNVISPIEASMMLDNDGIIDDTSYMDFMNANPDKGNFFTPVALSPSETEMKVMSGQRVVQDFFTPGQPAPQPVSNTQGMTTQAPKNEGLISNSRFTEILNRLKRSDKILNTNPTPAPAVQTPEPAAKVENDTNAAYDWTKFFSNDVSTPAPTTEQPTATTPAPAPAVEAPKTFDEKVSKFFAPEEGSVIKSALDYSTNSMQQLNALKQVAASRNYDPDKFIQRVASISPEEMVEIVSAYDLARARSAQAENVAPTQTFGTTYKPDREIPGVSIAGVPSNIKATPSQSIFGGTSPIKQWGI